MANKTLNIPSGSTRIIIGIKPVPGHDATFKHRVMGGTWVTPTTGDSQLSSTATALGYSLLAAENTGTTQRSCTIYLSGYTASDSAYEGTAEGFSSITITQAAAYVPPTPTTIITVTCAGDIGSLSELYFGLATANTASAIVASGYTVGLDVEEVASYTLQSTTQPMYLFFKGNTTQTLSLGVGSDSRYYPWVGGSMTGRYTVTTTWQSSGQSVSSWSSGLHHYCPIYATT